ncbi:hypothetical protein D9Q98_006407 [Chlorella vulgaris]|uniref:Uncharacterized protein n=1 Tax=Chlorella vulgaris TaxID=3077 RepID=A0A9D4YUZ4_CHLVU|nr:hypothetical protein D9Q98_006407 [Chlorella vulgaris]
MPWPLLLLLLACTPRLHAHTPAEQQASLEKLFAAIDTDGDGQLDENETTQFAAATLDFTGTVFSQEGWTAQAAQQASAQALDGPDPGASVSRAEVAAHLVTLLQDHRVEEWVTHGLNLPQYAAAFRQAAITALDFPLLVSDGGATLGQELGVSSRLHQQQILRGLSRLILGLGQVPSAPRHLECSPANRSALRLSWLPPVTAGHPSFHKYVLQRQRVVPAQRYGYYASSGTAGRAAGTGGEEPWEVVAEPDDEDSSCLDLPPAKGAYKYRLAAWSQFGRSMYAGSTGSACAIRYVQQDPRQPPPQQPLTATDMQTLLAAVAAAGGNLSGGQAAGGGVHGTAASGGGVWSWSAASSAAIVSLTILLKASQLRVGGVVLAVWRRCAARTWWLAGQRGDAGTGSTEEVGETEQEAQQAGSGAVPSGGMRRAGSSRVSLAGLSSEQGMCEASAEQQQRYQEQSVLQQLQPKPTAQRQLQQAILRGAHCAHPGCHRRFDRLRDLRRKLESHYCGLCQRVYCLQHTCISPHGTRGGCGLESQCICFDCFAELAPLQQAACERANRLPRQPSSSALSSAPVPASAAEATQDSSQAGEMGQQASQAAEAAAEGSAAAAPAASGPQAASDAAAAPQAAAGGGGTPVGGIPASPTKRWRKAGAVLKAVLRFKAAGSSSMH